MKKLYITITCFLLLNVCLPALYAQDTIPNASFERWPIANQNNPEFWDSSNKITMVPFVGYTSVEKTTDAWDGDFAVRLVTGSLFGTVIPGLLTLGIFDLNPQDPLQSISGGVPFSARPAMLRGYYKYETSGIDRGLILFGLFKFNESTGQKDTIAAGIGLLTQVEEFTLFSVPLIYLIDQEPDTMNIVILSSFSDEMVVGSALKIDDLHFVFGTFPEVDLGPDLYICPGQFVILDAGGGEGYLYFWVNVETGEIISQERILSVDVPGHYGVLVLNELGLPGSDQIHVFGAPAPAIFEVTGGGEYHHPDQGVVVGLSGSEIGVNYFLFRDSFDVGQWQGTGQELTFGLQPVGNYSVLAVNEEHGCESEMEGIAEVVLSSSIWVDAFAGQIGVFPNPAKGSFQIKTNWPSVKGELIIMNSAGKKVHEQYFETNLQGMIQHLKVSHLEAGVYFIQLKNSLGEQKIFRLICLP